jgi:methylated-DNA-[protein]-cysteine S-methyltransferase
MQEQVRKQIKELIQERVRGQVQELELDQVSSPIGDILIISDHGRLCGVEFAGYEARTLGFLKRRYGEFNLTPAQTPTLSQPLLAYLEGDYSAVDQLPISLEGTAFQQQVWLALRCIPAGTVLTYGQLAEQLGKPTASRAVGMTNGLNPIAIVLPCHRVIGANGNLTGYAGGLERKRWLLEHEGVRLNKYRQMQLSDQELRD